jgi:hypothetical protein
MLTNQTGFPQHAPHCSKEKAFFQIFSEKGFWNGYDNNATYAATADFRRSVAFQTT